MSYAFTGSTGTERLEAASAARVFGDLPFTISGWCLINDTSKGGIFGLTDPTNTQQYAGPLLSGGSFYAQVARPGSGTIFNVASSTGPTTATWLPFVMTMTTTQIQISLNGSALAATTWSGSPTWTNSYVGQIWKSGGATSFNGKIAALAIHSGIWGANEVALHKGGLRPNRISGCVHYWPLDSTSQLADTVGTLSFTNNGATLDAANPTLNDNAPGSGRPIITYLF